MDYYSHFTDEEANAKDYTASKWHSQESGSNLFDSLLMFSTTKPYWPLSDTFQVNIFK